MMFVLNGRLLATFGGALVMVALSGGFPLASDAKPRVSVQKPHRDAASGLPTGKRQHKPFTSGQPKR